MSDFNEEFAIELGLRLKNGAIASIQKQLNELSGQTININIGGGINGTNIKQETEKLVDDVNKTTKKVDPVQLINAESRKAFEKAIQDILSDEEALQKATRAHFDQFGKVTTKIFRDSTSNIQSFIVQVENAKGEIEALRYKWEEAKDESGNGLGYSLYFYQGSTGTDNYTKVVKQAIKQEQAHQQQIDRNNAAATRYAATLESLRSKYEDVNASKAITNNNHQEQLQAQYNVAIAANDALKNADQLTFASMEANVNAEISKLRSMITEFRNAEYAANQLRAKPIEVIKQDEINLLREFEAKIKQSGIQLSSFSKIGGLDALTALKDKVAGITDKESLTAYLNLLANVKTEWKALVQERKLEIQQEEKFTQNINADYQSLLSIMKEIGNTQISLLKSDPEKDSEKINELKQGLSELYDSYTTLFDAFEILAPTSVVRDLNDEWIKIEKNIKLVKAEINDTTAEQNAKRVAQEHATLQKEASKKVKLALQEQENEYKNLINLVSKIGTIRQSLVGLYPTKDSQQISVLRNQLRDLFSEYTQAKMSFATVFPTHSLDELNSKWQEVKYNINLAKAKIGDTTAEQKAKQAINDAYQELVNKAEQIQSLRIDLTTTDGSKTGRIEELLSQLLQLNSAYNSLYQSFERQLSTKQIDKLNGIFDNTSAKIRTINADLADTSAIQNQTDAFNQLFTIAKKIDTLNVTIAGLKNTGEHSNEIQVLETQLEQLQSDYKALYEALQGDLSTDQLEKLGNAFYDVQSKVEQLNARLLDAKQKLANDVQIKITDNTLEGQISSIETKFQRLHINSQEINDDFTKLRSLMANMDGNDDIESVNADYQEYLQTLTQVKNKVAELQRQQSLQRDSVNLSNQRSALSSQIDVWLHKNSAAARQFGDELERIKAQISSADKIKLSQLKSQFQDVKRQAELAGKTGLSLADGFKRSLKTVSTYFSGMMLITRSISLIRKMYTNVLQVDTAMTELYRVTDLTSSQYSKLYDNMTNSAKNYGATLDSIIKSTASWVRLGFDAETSNKLAEITSMYQHVTDLDESTAVKNLVTAYKGYQSELLQVSGGDSAKAVTKVADVYDKIGNEFAISASDIGESMRRSAASLEMAGNTFEEAVGMNTGIAEVTQNAEQAGTAINVVSLRLRGMKGQLEEIGEEVDENVESISKMQTHILNLTNGKVNIFKDNGDFKSTYQIFKEIDAVWKDLTDTSQADLLETIAGKQRANAIAALLNNFSQAEKAVQAASNAEGTATKENEKYLKSMQGRIDSMKASAQALSNSFLSSDLLKGLISGASTLLNITDGLIKNFGALPTLIAAVTAALSFKNIGRDKMFFLLNMPIVITVLFGYG